MAAVLENINGTPEFKNIVKFMRELEYEKLVKSSYAPLRYERWYGYYSNMQSIKEGRHELGYDEPIPNYFHRIKELYYPEADSILLCFGEKPNSDTSIAPHRDHGCFEGKAVMLNIGVSEYVEFPYDEPSLAYELGIGDVVEIDTKLVHSANQLSDIRMNATLRKVKKEFLPSQSKPLF
jgi:hypothetical protein